MAKSPYDRKEWHRKHDTNKNLRWMSKGVDAAFRGTNSTIDTAARANMPDSTLEERQRANLTGKQLLIACVAGAVLPLATLLSAEKIDGMYLIVLTFFFLIPFLVMVLIFKIFNVITRPRTTQISVKDSKISEQYIYSPNPEWTGETVSIHSRADAEMLAPQFLKQAQESAKILQTTTDPAVFFPRYDFCLGRLLQLEECKKHGIAVSTTSDLKKYQSLSFRDESVNDIIHRTAEKYRTKIENLKTTKAKKNWAEKYQQAFKLYLPYMSDEQKTELDDVSVALFALADAENTKE